jgi:ribonuclease HII
MLKSCMHTGIMEAGCDEAGRGCLAGPVFAAAVILPADFRHPGLDDSKKLSEKSRYMLREVVQSEAVCYGVASAGPEEIDSMNIQRASILAMHRAIGKLDFIPGHLLIDGNRFSPYQDIDHTTVIKGDSRYMSIAAASILAKTYRDDFMRMIHEDHPEYCWDSNKGYPTARHRHAIREYGPTRHHRMSFALIPLQTRLKFE